MELTYSGIQKVFKNKKYAFFTKKMDLNLFGVRIETDENTFDDVIGVAYIDESGSEIVKTYPATTDPGSYWLKNPLNKNGTAILVPGQYRGVYKTDLHAGKYSALCQRGGKVKVYRDGDRDTKHDMKEETIQEGRFGINIHRSNPYSESYQIDKWSAGCQVFKRVADFHEFMNLVKMEEKIHGNDTHTYTLLTKADVEPKKSVKAAVKAASKAGVKSGAKKRTKKK